MSTENKAQDPLEFMRNMWGKMGFSLPGMVTPTLDVDELDKRIADMKAVEQWLKMNLNMLQMSTQGLELQRATLAAVKAMSQQSEQQADSEQACNPFAQAMMWPWSLMATPATTESATEESSSAASKTRSTRTRKTSSDKSE